MHMLLQQGKRNVEIIRILKEEYGIHGVTQASVSQFRRRHGYPVRKSPDGRDLLMPWKIQEGDFGRVYRALLARVHELNGKEIPRSAHLSVLRLRGELDAKHVIHYDRTNGFVLVPRREGIDKGWIRDPRFADNGEPITDEELWQ